MTENMIYPNLRTAKTIAQQMKWKHMKCKRCGAELPRYPSYSEHFEEKICSECGYVHRKLRPFKKVRE